MKNCALSFAICTLLIVKTLALCRDSYLTFCDDFRDLKDRQLSTITELVIGSDDGTLTFQVLNQDLLPLRSLHRLKGLTIVGRLKKITRRAFQTRAFFPPLLNYLRIHGNQIKHLDQYAFDCLRVDRFSFTQNNLECIHREAFFNCEFKSIDLSYNNLEFLEKGVMSDEVLIPGATEVVLLRYNQLMQLPPKTLPTSLKILALDHNNLRYLAPDIFTELVNLEELTMAHNKLTMLPDLHQLVLLRKLDASSNNLNFLDLQTFNCLPQLQVLNLNQNFLFDANIFHNFYYKGAALKLALAYNRFTHLNTSSAFQRFKNVEASWFGNPWNCACWEILECLMEGHKIRRNKCDLKHFGHGDVPYCIQYKEDCGGVSFGSKSNLTEEDLSEFLGLIDVALEQTNFGCSLDPEFYTFTTF